MGIPVLGAEQQTLDEPVTLGPTASEQAGDILSDFLNRPDEIPDDINRQNLASHKRNWDAHSATGPAGDADVPESIREVISSSGRSLDASIQRAVEDRMGDSFGDVRIHTGPNAAAACEDINARAFTVGNHIAFNSGEYDPKSQEGQHLLAHELAHVRQQTGGALSMLPREGLEVDPDPVLEREAQVAAERVMDGGTLGISRMQKTGIHIQRMPDRSQSYEIGSGNASDSESTHTISFSDGQLQKKFKHADDFGVTESWNLDSKEAFRRALKEHIADKDTIAIDGTYRGETIPVTHYFNTRTSNNVMIHRSGDKRGEFLSGWTLDPEQANYVTSTGDL
ncbi:hypothetical protein C479_06187 [Halovivax asiaticus JCM 14624]|uniref:DUF4157 domain-containing protein n=1 Tax=Halovivax asiaticus JCM 14624 TaxID=1227490 RepID=M0BNI3_9EURY|nr:DUF4157 domain-containing protein [Halovivax asiaticus]ELZ12012.1 hypothetical protein C479_06187 [Halovivax asiaticus JCM 14624]